MNRFFDHTVNKSKLIDRRQFFLTISKAIIFSGIVARLFTLQISENKKYTTLSDKNRLREWKILPKRGIFEDYFGKKIADNNQVFQLHLIPENVEDFNYEDNSDLISLQVSITSNDTSITNIEETPIIPRSLNNIFKVNWMNFYSDQEELIHESSDDFSDILIAHVLDDGGSPVKNVPVHFELLTGSGYISSELMYTDDQGFASIEYSITSNQLQPLFLRR